MEAQSSEYYCTISRGSVKGQCQGVVLRGSVKVQCQETSWSVINLRKTFCTCYFSMINRNDNPNVDSYCSSMVKACLDVCVCCVV